jgi:hypothetical protein
MHLHGFYFDVERQGDGIIESAIPAAEQLHVVTQLRAAKLALTNQTKV